MMSFLTGLAGAVILYIAAQLYVITINTFMFAIIHLFIAGANKVQGKEVVE